jgi:hypothetical protein
VSLDIKQLLLLREGYMRQLSAFEHEIKELKFEIYHEKGCAVASRRFKKKFSDAECVAIGKAKVGCDKVMGLIEKIDVMCEDAVNCSFELQEEAIASFFGAGKAVKPPAIKKPPKPNDIKSL